jgi:hypothetical protein
MTSPEHLEILKKSVEAWSRTEPFRTGGVDLRGVDLRGADLHRADLRGANLDGADLSFSNLSEANLCEAGLRAANLSRAILSLTDFSNTRLGYTVFGAVDLTEAKNLHMCRNEGPSTIGIDTIYHSKGKIAEEFLRGAGVPDNFITFIRSLTCKALECYPCFISYPSVDQGFA